MFRTTLNRLLLAAVVATCVLSLSAKPSEAGWPWWGCGWHHYYSPCCTTLYRPVVYAPIVYRSSCCSPVCCYSRSCYWRSCYRPCVYTYCNPCYSYCCDPCGWGCGYGCGCGVVYDQGVYGKSTTTQKPTPATPTPAAPEAPTPAEPNATPPAPDAAAPATNAAPADATTLPPVPGHAAPADATTLPPVPGPAATNLRNGSVTLAVDVPEDARVYVNGHLTATPGMHRRYVSRGLVPGYGYTYNIRAVVNRDGQELSDQHVVHVRAGENKQVAFNFGRTQPQELAARVPTTLTVRVPEGAKVLLEGRATDATGATRQFTTNELAKGEKWEGYNVVVKLDRNGRVDTRRKTIDLIGGQSHTVTFDFALDRLALR